VRKQDISSEFWRRKRTLWTPRNGRLWCWNFSGSCSVSGWGVRGFSGSSSVSCCGVEVFQGLVHCPVVVLKFFHTGRSRSSQNLVLLHVLYNRFCEAQSRTEPVVPKIFTYLHIDIPTGKGASGTFLPDVYTTPVLPYSDCRCISFPISSVGAIRWVGCV